MPATTRNSAEVMAVLVLVEAELTNDEAGMLQELIDANKPRVALEI